MRIVLGILLILTAAGCSPMTGESGFGSRLVPASCIAEAAPWILGEKPIRAYADYSVTDSAPVLRAVTYNIHSGLGPERAFFQPRAVVIEHLDGIADAISRAGPSIDVVGLNEVDFGSRRSGRFDQAMYLAEALERRTGERYEIVYGQTWSRRLPGFEVRFGNAALVRHPIIEAKACLYDEVERCGIATDLAMPPLQAKGLLSRLTREARGLIRLTIDFAGHPVDVLVTHLDAFVLPEREAQAAHLLRRVVDPRRTTLVLGDFNAVPTVMTYTRALFAADRTHDILTSGGLADARILFDSRRASADLRAWATYPASAPAWPLDTVLASLDMMPRDVKVIAAPYSDHYGFYTEYRLLTDPRGVAEQRKRHDAIRRRQLAQIMRCDLAAAGAAQVQWLMTGTGFMDIAAVLESKEPVIAF